MAIATQLTVEEYLRTSFDTHQEFVDGDVIERVYGERRHSETVQALIEWFFPRVKTLGIFALQSWTFRVAPNILRIPDFVILAGPEPDEPFLETRPLVCIEILQSDDRMSAVCRKISDYLAHGVRYVWILNPETREAFAYTEGGVHQVTDFLRTDNPAIEIPLAAIFESDPQG